ncbi:MAG TPA: protein kinase [Bryobacteraceae bacterium]|nr:protein kinase [Bryobacteraceae bacterium]
MNIALQPGVVLDGKYRIERHLGKGGMGAVFQATHLGTTRTVAVKVIVPKFAGQDEFLLRFQREAEAAGRLRHPNVVNVTDFGFNAIAGSHLAYLVMEFLDGCNLGEFLDKNPRPATDEILDILDQVALALSAAHESGVVHRDLKPDNIWLQPNHRDRFNVKVLDFGIAKLQSPAAEGMTDRMSTASSLATVPGPLTKATATPTDLESETLATSPAETQAAESATMVTMAASRATPFPSGVAAGSLATRLQTTVGSVLGTPAYMAPEQCRGANVEAAADIYSLAVISYQMFCGCLPFESKSLEELLRMQREDEPVAPSERDCGVSAPVSRIILSGLAKDPVARPSSAISFAAQLRAASEGEVKVLADGKIVGSNHGRSVFPLLLACFAPQIPIMGLLYLAGKALMAKGVISANCLAIVQQLFLIAVPYFLAQCYKAGVTLLVEEARAAGHFGSQWKPHLGKLLGNIRSLAAMHLRSAFDPRPVSFLSSQLWPMVWASEGISGRAALDRAADLARATPAATAALAVRHWAIILAPALFVPTILTIMGGDLGHYASLMTGSSNAVSIFAIVYPMFLSIMLLRFFGPAFFFLYLSARRCLGEAVDAHIPSASRLRRSRRAKMVRVGTVFWLALPLGLIGLILSRALSGANTVHNLLDAASDGRMAELQRMLDSGLAVDSSIFPRHITALMQAAAKGHLDMVRLLLARHADVNARDFDDESPLLLAVWNRRADAASLLIAAGADVNAENSDGRTPLFAVAIHGDAALCRLLLSKGAEPEHRDRASKSALDYARQEGQAEIVALLSSRP